jgi:hypothetical protein
VLHDQHELDPHRGPVLPPDGDVGGVAAGWACSSRECRVIGLVLLAFILLQRLVFARRT